MFGIYEPTGCAAAQFETEYFGNEHLRENACFSGNRDALRLLAEKRLWGENCYIALQTKLSFLSSPGCCHFRFRLMRVKASAKSGRPGAAFATNLSAKKGVLSIAPSRSM